MSLDDGQLVLEMDVDQAWVWIVGSFAGLDALELVPVDDAVVAFHFHFVSGWT